MFLTQDNTALDSVLATNIRNHRIFYVVEAISHPGVLKVGMAHPYAGKVNQPLDRLRSYLTDYGPPPTAGNPCSGVKLRYLEYTRFTPGVSKQDSRVGRIEKRVKGMWFMDKSRGKERTFPDIPLQTIIDIADSITGGDVRKAHRRRSLRRKRRPDRLGFG
jgi:hypothetical protein